MRRSPFGSRPPGDFALAWHGSDYEVWKRTPGAAPPREHLALGTGEQPGGTLSCRAAAALAARGRASGARLLRFASREANVVPPLSRAKRTRLAALQRDGSIAFTGPGTVTARLVVPRAATYRLWVEGDTGRALRATIDGRPAGVVRGDSGGEGNVLEYDADALSAGPHVLRLERGGGSLRPGDAAFTNVRAIALEPVAAEAHPIRTIPIGHWRALCGQQLDWVETV